MQIKVKLFATLRENREKEMMMDLVQGATPKDIIERLNIRAEEAAIIMINGRGANSDQVLEDNDTVSIFPPVGGG
ncbi:MAG: molybdopterin synthase sulfur carrier subunit [Clostridiales bacterium GWB2_37_7]|nr:MAG: molybdopterin synthase sulfur carrier subunit [Clostridiales bacterium GWB2_37_7]